MDARHLRARAIASTRTFANGANRIQLERAVAQIFVDALMRATSGIRYLLFGAISGVSIGAASLASNSVGTMIGITNTMCACVRTPGADTADTCMFGVLLASLSCFYSVNKTGASITSTPTLASVPNG